MMWMCWHCGDVDVFTLWKLCGNILCRSLGCYYLCVHFVKSELCCIYLCALPNRLVFGGMARKTVSADDQDVVCP